MFYISSLTYMVKDRDILQRIKYVWNFVSTTALKRRVRANFFPWLTSLNHLPKLEYTWRGRKKGRGNHQVSQVVLFYFMFARFVRMRVRSSKVNRVYIKAARRYMLCFLLLWVYTHTILFSNPGVALSKTADMWDLWRCLSNTSETSGSAWQDCGTLRDSSFFPPARMVVCGCDHQITAL